MGHPVQNFTIKYSRPSTDGTLQATTTRWLNGSYEANTEATGCRHAWRGRPGVWSGRGCPGVWSWCRCPRNRSGRGRPSYWGGLGRLRVDRDLMAHLAGRGLLGVSDALEAAVLGLLGDEAVPLPRAGPGARPARHAARTPLAPLGVEAVDGAGRLRIKEYLIAGISS